MTKNEFLVQLRKGLSCLAQKDIAEQLSFYNEIIEDRIEEGLSEEEAVAAVGPVEEIAAQIIEDIPVKRNAKRRLKAGEILLLILGSPIWLSLGIAAVAVVFSLYISGWAILVALWAVFVSLVACAFCAVVAGAVFVCNGNVFSGIATLAGGFVCAGLSIFLFYSCKATSKGMLLLTQKITTRTNKKGDAE